MYMLVCLLFPYLSWRSRFTLYFVLSLFYIVISLVLFFRWSYLCPSSFKSTPFYSPVLYSPSNFFT